MTLRSTDKGVQSHLVTHHILRRPDPFDSPKEDQRWLLPRYPLNYAGGLYSQVWTALLERPRSMRTDMRRRVFYWFGAYYDKALLAQASLMIVVQLILLKVALDNRAPTGARDGLHHTPFHGYTAENGLQDLLSGRRPYDFWQWNSAKP